MLEMLQFHSLRAIFVVAGNIFYGRKKYQICSYPADLTSLHCLMTDTISTYKCGLDQVKLLVLLLFLLDSADLQQNVSNVSCSNERAFLSAVGFCVHTITVHTHREDVGRGGWG